MKMIGNVSDWLSYAGGALIKVADSAGSTVYRNDETVECIFIKCMLLCRNVMKYKSKLKNIWFATFYWEV